MRKNALIPTFTTADGKPVNVIEFIGGEIAAIDWIVTNYDRIAPRMSGETARHQIRGKIKEMLAQGVLPTMRAIELAREYAAIDDALREHAQEVIERHEMLPVSLAAYVQRALVDRTPRGRGRDVVDNFMRDIGIACLVTWTSLNLGIHPTKNRERSGGKPSACSLVHRALSRNNRMPISERRVETVYTGINTIAARLEAAIPLAAH